MVLKSRKVNDMPYVYASLIFYTLTHVVSEHNTMSQKFGSQR